MRRLGLVVIATLILGAAFVPEAAASPTLLPTDVMYGVLRMARVPHLSGGGAATSSFELCYWVDDGLVEDADIPCQGITVGIVGRPPGEVWSVELYDRGTCLGPHHRIAILAPLRIGSKGHRTRRVVLSQAGLHAMEPAMYGRLALGLSKPGYRVCASYGPYSGGGA